MLLNLIVFLLFQAVYQITARTAADLAVKVDKFNLPSKPNTISGSTSTISSGSKTTGLIPQPKNLHRHSKRGAKTCGICKKKISTGIFGNDKISDDWRCTDMFHQKCADRHLANGNINCPNCGIPNKGNEKLTSQSSPQKDTAGGSGTQQRQLGNSGPTGYGHGGQPAGYGYGGPPAGYGYGGPPAGYGYGGPPAGYGYGGPPGHGPPPMYGTPGYPQSGGASYSGYSDISGYQPRHSSLASYPTYTGGPVPPNHQVVCYYSDED